MAERRHRGSGLALAAAAALSVAGTAFFAFSPPGPSDAAVCAAAAELRRGYRPGDHILLVPAYATRAREYLGDLEPVAPLRVELEDLQARPRVWAIGTPPAIRRAARALEAEGLVARAVESRSEREVELVRLDNRAPAAIRTRFLDRLDAARVELALGGGRRLPCTQRKPGKGDAAGVRWVCPRNSDWQYVAAEWHRMGDHPRRCLWAHPPAEGELWIHFDGVPRQGELVGRAGHTLQSSRHANAPVDLTVQVGDWVETHRFEVADTWRPFRQDLAARLGPTQTATTTVSFAVSSPDNGANHFCFVADVRARGGSPGES